MFTVQDKSNYLKGLVILAKKDNRLFENEKNIIRDVAKRFGFSKDFYEEILKSLLENKYIAESPIVFSNSSIAKLFLTDGFKLAASDNELCENELKWLKEIAKANNIVDDWFDEIYKKNIIIDRPKV